MVEKNNVFKCELCGNVVELLHVGVGELVCCGKPMLLLEENSVDASIEKHVPVIEKKDNGFFVSVGSVEHPMSVEHYIEWIELIIGNCVYRVNLSVGEKPSAFFCVSSFEKISARAYCNLHGLWKNQL